MVKGHRKESGELYYSIEKEGQRKWYKRMAVILSLEQGNRLREQYGLGPYEAVTPLTKAADISLGETCASGLCVWEEWLLEHSAISHKPDCPLWFMPWRRAVIFWSHCLSLFPGPNGCTGSPVLLGSTHMSVMAEMETENVVALKGLCPVGGW